MGWGIRRAEVGVALTAVIALSCRWWLETNEKEGMRKDSVSGVWNRFPFFSSPITNVSTFTYD